uniref:F-box domain-containing protein n=1 Tax=Strongyloides papillosus TaxID=174720 RepID=A0A0N5BEZ3_STREA
MDFGCSVMDYSTVEEHSEEQDYTPVLSDDALLLILSELSWKDILNVKLVSRRFYGIIHVNYHRLPRRRVLDLSIKYNGTCGKYPFYFKMGVMTVQNGSSGVVQYDSYSRVDRFKNDEELSSSLKMVDLRNLDKFNVPVADNIDIFSILNRSFQVGTKIGVLNIPKLSDKDLKSFQTFVEKLSSVKEIVVNEICAHSTEAKDVSKLLSSLASFNTIEKFHIHECSSTKILSAGIIIELLRRNPDIKSLSIGTGNIEFARSIFEGFFRMEQQSNVKNECLYNKITVQIYFSGEYGLLIDTLRNSLSELENVIKDIHSTPEYVQFDSIVDCKYCFENKHGISKCFFVWDDELSTLIRDWNQ